MLICCCILIPCHCFAMNGLVLLSSQDNALSTFFFAVALILSKRTELMTCDESQLPEVLMNMSAASIDEVHRQWRNGNELRIQQTPPSFQRLMASRLLRPLDKPNQSLQGAIKSMQEAVSST